MKYNNIREENWFGKIFYVKITVLIIFIRLYSGKRYNEGRKRFFEMLDWGL